MEHPVGQGSWILAGIVGTVVALVLFGCATLDKAECINADWKTIGFEDGARGYKGSRIGRHREACAKHGVAPDLDLYESGRRQGILEWCTPRNGYRLGVRGKSYNGVCPGTLEAEFVAAMDQGHAVYAYSFELKKQEDLLRYTASEFDALNDVISAKEAELVSDNVSPRRRMKLLDEVRYLEEEQRYLKAYIEDIKDTLEDMRSNLKRMQENNPFP